MSPWAKASLITGILGLAVLPLTGGVLAIVFARKARKQITTDFEGIGLATAGQTLGIVSLVLVAVGIYAVFNQEGLRKFKRQFFDWGTLKHSFPLLAGG